MNHQFAEIGKRLSQYISNKGISQSKLARLTATSASQVFNMLNGTKYGIDKLLLVFNALPDLSPEWLLFGSGPMEKEKPGAGLRYKKLEKLTTANEISEDPAENASPENTAKWKEMEEQLQLCQAEKAGLEKIVILKNEMIEMLKEKQ